MSDEKKQPVQVLSIKQKKFLKGLAHPLSPVVQIGKDDITQGVLDSIEKELLNHELIKVKIGSNSGVDKNQAAGIIPQRTGSALVQLIGKTLILFKENRKKQRDKRINLPRA